MAKTPTDVLARFKKAQDERIKQRIIGLSIGEPGSRKTTFWLEAPAPIVILSLDFGTEGVIQHVLEEHPEKDIRIREYDWSIANRHDEGDELQEKAIELRDQLTDDYEYALDHARTIVFDKETDVWEMFRYAEFGKPNENPRDYGPLNMRFRKIINLAKSSDINLGFIEGLKDEWGAKVKKGGGDTFGKLGNRKRSGFFEAEGLMNVVFLHTGLSPDDWAIQVGKARGPNAMAVANQTFTSATFDHAPSFVDIATLLFPDTTEEDWQ